MDRFKQIETFAAVASKGSLSAAAQAEGVAPAIIGRRLDALEERLGVKLLVRTTLAARPENKTTAPGAAVSIRGPAGAATATRRISSDAC